MANRICYIYGLMAILSALPVLAEPELSDEYKALRNEVTNKLRKPYRECIDKENTEKYSLALQECESQGKGVGIGGGCEHVAGYNPNYNDAVDYDCELLRPSIEEYRDILELERITRGIQKYRD